MYIADYIEETRPYEACRAMRESFYSAIPDAIPQRRDLLDTSVFRVLQETVSYLRAENRIVHPRSLAARDDFALRIEEKQKSENRKEIG